MHFEKFKLLQSYLKPICSLLEKSFTVLGPVMMKETLLFEKQAQPENCNDRETCSSINKEIV